ncbi:MAG: hypothetical protein E7638_01805 [Ruminococcaceae bacterium]|nr:hypothetical protein [Oscillospiraceae bacterium]
MQKRGTRLKILVGIGVGILIFVILLFGFGIIETMIDNADRGSLNDEEFSYSDHSVDEISYNGVYYTPKSSLDTLLILGIDSSEERPDSAQADFIALVVMDRDRECFDVLHLNRDTMADIPEIDTYGDQYGTEFAQLALAHTYGADDKMRCRNTVNTIENLLYDINIDHYLSLTMDALPLINDSVGGVTVQLLDDFTFLNENYTKDAVVTLHGDHALRYVRARGEMEDSTNLRRMERQKQYISALVEKYNTTETEDTLETMLEINEHLVSDCTVDQLSRLIEKMQTYTYNGVTTIEGESVVNTFMEYHLDEQSARETIIRLFYEPVEQ